MSVGELHTSLSGIKQDLLDFKNEIISVLVNIRTEMQSKFDDINNRLNVFKNNIKSSINNQVNESMANIEDFIINPLKDDNKKLHSEIEDLETKLHETELSFNRLDQYNWRNNIEMQGIPSNVADEAIEDKLANVFKSLNIDTKKSDIEGCRRLGKANPKNTIVRIVNRKHAEEAQARRSDLKKVDNVNLNFESNVVLFFSENLTPFNQRLAWKCREVKRAGEKHSSWSCKEVIKLRQTMNEKAISISHDNQIADLYPDFVFKEGQS